MSYIQAQADLAASDLPPQEGDTRENVIALGYGYPETIDTIFCTTSSAIKSLTDVPPDFGTPEERAVNNVYYRHIGFGISKGVGDWDGYIFYMLLACYGADNRYTPGPPGQPNPLLGTAAPASVSQVMIPVRTAAPQPNGQIIHEVLSGQTLWAIAVAYQTHIKDILSLNHLPLDAQMVYQGQKLLIPTPGNKVSISNPTQTTAKIFTPTHSTYSRTPVPSTDTPPFVHAQSTTTPTVSGEYESPSNNNILIIAIILAGCLVVVLISLFKK
jgi:LysM repeat protein